MLSRFSIPFTFLRSDRNLVCLERCAISQRTTVRKTVLAGNNSSYEFIYLFSYCRFPVLGTGRCDLLNTNEIGCQSVFFKYAHPSSAAL